jgi:hypothetical protein
MLQHSQPRQLALQIPRLWLLDHFAHFGSGMRKLPLLTRQRSSKQQRFHIAQETWADSPDICRPFKIKPIKWPNLTLGRFGMMVDVMQPSRKILANRTVGQLHERRLRAIKC